MLVTLPSPHPKAPTHPSAPEMLRARERAPTPYSFVVSTLDSIFESTKGVRSTSQRLLWDLYAGIAMNVKINDYYGPICGYCIFENDIMEFRI
jgi:hypothetical protein